MLEYPSLTSVLSMDILANKISISLAKRFLAKLWSFSEVMMKDLSTFACFVSKVMLLPPLLIAEANIQAKL